MLIPIDGLYPTINITHGQKVYNYQTPFDTNK